MMNTELFKIMTLVACLFNFNQSLAACVTENFNWASKWDLEFTVGNWKRLQHPYTNECISGSDLTNKKINGVYFQNNEHVVFRQTSGVSGRTEIRSQNMQGEHAQIEARFMFEEFDLGDRNITVGQMFDEGYGPIVRIENYHGTIRVAVKSNKNCSSSGCTKNYFAVGNASLGTWYTYKITRNGDKVTVSVNNKEVVNVILDGSFSTSQTYFKVGCYMSNSTNASGCRTKFDSIKYTI